LKRYEFIKINNISEEDIKKNLDEEIENKIQIEIAGGHDLVT